MALWSSSLKPVLVLYCFDVDDVAKVYGGDISDLTPDGFSKTAVAQMVGLHHDMNALPGVESRAVCISSLTHDDLYIKEHCPDGDLRQHLHDNGLELPYHDPWFLPKLKSQLKGLSVESFIDQERRRLAKSWRVVLVVVDNLELVVSDKFNGILIQVDGLVGMSADNRADALSQLRREVGIDRAPSRSWLKPFMP